MLVVSPLFLLVVTVFVIFSSFLEVSLLSFFAPVFIVFSFVAFLALPSVRLLVSTRFMETFVVTTGCWHQVVVSNFTKLMAGLSFHNAVITELSFWSCCLLRYFLDFRVYFGLLSL